MWNLHNWWFTPGKTDFIAPAIAPLPSEIINFETGEWKINYDFGDEGKYSSDITSMRKCFDSDIPIGVIYKPEKGVNKILGLGKISSNDGAKFTIIPYEIENKSSQVENLSSS